MPLIPVFKFPRAIVLSESYRLVYPFPALPGVRVLESIDRVVIERVVLHSLFKTVLGSGRKCDGEALPQDRKCATVTLRLTRLFQPSACPRLTSIAYTLSRCTGPDQTRLCVAMMGNDSTSYGGLRSHPDAAFHRWLALRWPARRATEKFCRRGP